MMSSRFPQSQISVPCVPKNKGPLSGPVELLPANFSQLFGGRGWIHPLLLLEGRGIVAQKVNFAEETSSQNPLSHLNSLGILLHHPFVGNILFLVC